VRPPEFEQLLHPESRGGSDPEAVVISAGFNKTHVTTAAAEASARETLRLCITGAYPTPLFRGAVRLLGISDKGRLARLLERAEDIPPERVHSMLLPEFLYDLARALGRVPFLRQLHLALCAATWRLYGWLAARRLTRAADARIFHFRAGFGNASLRRAKALGMVTLCDQSLAHPLLLEELVDRGGQMPEHGDYRANSHGRRRDPITRAILTDIDQADAVVVNSDFVKETFLVLGVPADRIHVVYLGVDDNFLRGSTLSRPDISGGPLRLLFAGRFDRRKGANVLVAALSDLRDVDWELRIAGPIPPGASRAHRNFLQDERVSVLGTIRRPELMQEMLCAPVFVFPSLAEGSARVVFEALACGCYVITTPNSGTIVEDGVHGALIPPGDADGLREAVARADADRRRLAESGNLNAQLVAARFDQSAYGDALAKLYQDLASAANAKG
jgi:glycosyltransferase involved in cell wall biosynthesis